MRAYSSFAQLEEKGIHVDEYHFMEQEGAFQARLDFKRWGKAKNILAYFTFEDGRKVVASAWNDNDYLGIPEMEEGAVLMLTFKKSKKGKVYLRKVEKKGDGQ